MTSLLRGAILAAVAGGLTGCGGGGGGGSVVTGSVALDGHPLANAEIQLVPKTDAGLGTHTGTTGPDGRFTIRSEAANTPLKPGSYVVLVSKLGGADPSQPGGGMGGMKNEVPDLYRDRGKTPLNAEVQAGENTLPPFELKSGGKKG